MSCGKHPPPPYPGKLTIAVFGKKPKLKTIIGNILTDDKAFVKMPNDFLLGENNRLKIINTPDFFDEECPNTDQQIIDFMALSQPGPHLFILAIDSQNTEEEKVEAQIKKLQRIFGEKVTTHLIIALPDIETYQSLQHLKKLFGIELKTTNENLASVCTTWCSDHQPFEYDYKAYSEDVVKRRKEYFNSRRHDSPPYPCVRTDVNHPRHSDSKYADTEETESGHDIGEEGSSSSTSATGAPAELETVDSSESDPQQELSGGSNSRVSDYTFNIVLLGQTGTGKSASGNTILAAAKSFTLRKIFYSEYKQNFYSKTSSMPVTTECKVRMVKQFGREVRVVDTPDFFHDQLKNPQTHIDECKKYCQPGQFVALLVMQLGRITDGERGILEKLEEKLGRIRENTIVLLTHGDNETDVNTFIEDLSYLNTGVKECGNHYHVFNNTSKDRKQVTELIKKIPNYEVIFPEFTEKTQRCSLC